MEQGESIAHAALREIAEETGLADIRLGPVVWYGEDSRRSGDWGITFREHFIVAHSSDETLRKDGWTAHERNQILDMRWWDIGKLRASTDVIYPLRLAQLLEPIIAGEYPDRIIVLPPI